MILVNTYITLSFAFGATIYKSSHFILNNRPAREIIVAARVYLPFICTITPLIGLLSAKKSIFAGYEEHKGENSRILPHE